MKPGARIKDGCLAALLAVGSAAPVCARAHSEGVEAADPATPPAVLTFDGAAGRYTPLDSAPLEWRSLFADGAAGAAGRGHAEAAAAGGAHRHQGPAQHTPAPQQ